MQENIKQNKGEKPGCRKLACIKLRSIYQEVTVYSFPYKLHFLTGNSQIP